MSNVETLSANLQTVREFVETGWPEALHSRRVQEIISVFNESHRFTDSYIFFYDQGGFYMLAEDKETSETKKIYVRDVIERSSPPGRAEAEILDNLESWFDQNEEGSAFWMAPPRPNDKFRPGWKLIFHQIAYTSGGAKVLLHGADLFKGPPETVLSLIHQFFPETRNIHSIEAVRSLLIKPDDNFEPSKLLERIKEIDPDALAVNQKLDEVQLVERATYISELIYSRADSGFVAYEMERLGLVGEHAISCAGGEKTLSELIVDGLGMEDQYGSLEFACPKCGGTNSRPFGQLMSNCQHCGANVRC